MFFIFEFSARDINVEHACSHTTITSRGHSLLTVVLQ